MSWPSFWLRADHNHIAWQSRLLLPISRLVCRVARRRLQAFEIQPPPKSTDAKTIVVGNIVVGGSGKTPFIMWLVEQLQQQGFSCGIVSRGYGGKAKNWPQMVTPDSDPKSVGDEPVMLVRQAKVPMAVSPNRVDAIRYLEQNVKAQGGHLDVIISDDGLQHYAMARDVEIVMVDGERGLGNGMCLPSGPLRESKRRLKTVDFIVSNGTLRYPLAIADTIEIMRLTPVCFRNVKHPEKTLPLDAFKNQAVNAIAGIGNPARFYRALHRLGAIVISRDFADHQAYQPKDFSWLKQQKEAIPLLMTEKDAVKCVAFAEDDWWYLEIKPQCSQPFAEQIIKKLRRL
jgi:tetraacyldisaccharide 4'-kinase